MHQSSPLNSRQDGTRINPDALNNNKYSLRGQSKKRFTRSRAADLSSQASGDSALYSQMTNILRRQPGGHESPFYREEEPKIAQSRLEFQEPPMQNLPHNGVTVRFNGRLSFNKCPQAITDNFFVPTKLQPVPEVPVKNTQPKVKPYNQNNGNAYLQYILRKAKMAASNQQGYEQANGLTSSTKKTNNQKLSTKSSVYGSKGELKAYEKNQFQPKQHVINSSISKKSSTYFKGPGHTKDFSRGDVGIYEGSFTTNMTPMRSPDEVSEASTEHQFKKYSLRNKTKVNNSRVIVYSLKYNDLGDKIKGRNSEGLERAMSARIPFESPSSLLQSWRDSLAKYVCMTMPQVKDSEERCSCDNNKCHWIISWLLIEENLKKYTTGDSRCSEQPSKSIKTKSCVSYAARNFRYPNKDSYNSHLTANTAQSKKNIQYSSEISQWQSKKAQFFQQIDLDIPRTQSQHPAFKSQRNQERLRDLLRDYCSSDPQAGYVQGMNVIASVIIYHALNFSEEKRIMELIMRQLNYRKIYLDRLQGSQAEAVKTIAHLRENVHDLYKFLTDCSIDLEMFITSWYFSMFGSFVPLKSMHIVIDKFIRKEFAGLSQILVTLFLFLKEELMSQTESHEVMAMLANQNLTTRLENIDWDQLVQKSDYFDFQDDALI